MKVKEEYSAGVLVARFQVPELHEAHKKLIEYVQSKHDRVILFLGLAPVRATLENPLDFQARRQMVNEVFPELEVYYIADAGNDEYWSAKLDSEVDKLLGPSQKALLYGGRDSFIKHYTGKLNTEELESDIFVSGSVIREEVRRKSTRPNSDFRAGVIWATSQRFPTAFTTVDIAVFKDEKILLGKKATEPKYRLIGGFSDPNSETFEDDARREVMEEANITLKNLKYVKSNRVNDWRYRKEPDCIKTMLFTAEYEGGSPKAGDDIAEIKWFDVFKSTTGHSLVEIHNWVMPEHVGLVIDAATDYMRDKEFKA